jgi:hypothetical protein
MTDSSARVYANKYLSFAVLMIALFFGAIEYGDGIADMGFAEPEDSARALIASFVTAAAVAHHIKASPISRQNRSQ